MSVSTTAKVWHIVWVESDGQRDSKLVSEEDLWTTLDELHRARYHDIRWWKL